MSLRLNPAQPVVWNAMGLLYYKKFSQYVDATTCFERVGTFFFKYSFGLFGDELQTLLLDPKNVKAKMNLKEISEHEEAIFQTVPQCKRTSKGLQSSTKRKKQKTSSSILIDNSPETCPSERLKGRTEDANVASPLF